MSRKSAQDRFEEKYIPEPNSGCWLWHAAALPTGCGVFLIDASHSPGRKERYAHRASWILNKGEIPSGLSVLHRCDMPCCVNPDHLFLGTPKENTRDCMKKNRMPLGEGRPFAKLTSDDVRKIKQSEKSDIELGKQFNVSDSAIYLIRAGKTWKHVEAG